MNEQGRSMIEMLGVLAIIGVLSVGGIAGYSKAMEKHRVNKTVQQVTMIAGSIRTLFGSQKNYTDLGNKNDISFFKKAGIVPPEMVVGNGLVNPFGGSVTIAYALKDKSGDNKAFNIWYRGIPQEPCIDLLTMDWESEGFLGMAVNHDNLGNLTPANCSRGGKMTAGGKTYYCSGRALTPTEAVEACSSATSNRIVFKFY